MLQLVNETFWLVGFITSSLIFVNGMTTVAENIINNVRPR